MSQRVCVVLILVALLAPAPPVPAAQPQFWRIEGARDFLEGDLEGLAVDSEGRVRLAPAQKAMQNPETPFVWALARDAKGVLFAGTGNDGKVFRLTDGAATVFFDAPEMEVHALAFGPDGRLYVGTSPDGKVYVVDKAGQSETFYDPSERYIWALAFDKSGNLIVATGADGRLHRVDAKGKAQVLLTSPETHLTALATDASGYIYAGSSPGGILYRLDPAGKVFVLHDSAFREVKALEVGANGSLYAAVIDGREKESAPGPSLGIPTLSMIPDVIPPVLEAGTPTGQPPPSQPSPSPAPRLPEPSRGGQVKGALLRVLPSGDVETVWSSPDDTPHSLALTPDGALVGTGNKGKLYHVRDDRTWAMVGTFAAEQVTALVRLADGRVALATSNPGRLHTLESGSGETGNFVSKVKDAETAASWGRIRWEAVQPSGTRLEVMTRSGNTGTPDDTWSAWSPAYTRGEGEAVRSDKARFLQLKVILTGKAGGSPVLDALSTAYLQRNLRPQVSSITVHPAGEVFQKPLSLGGEMEILGLDAAAASPESRAASARMAAMPLGTFGRRLFQKGIQTLSWRADDPNGDTLSYDVHYRRVGDDRYRLLRKGLTDAVLAWDTSTVPNGRYLVKVVASDAPSNPETLALSGDKESSLFDVDNTPPTVTATLAQPRPPRIQAVARDESSLVRRAEYSVDGGRWQEIHPADGISDAREETYEFTPQGLEGAGPHLVVVRATDLLGNSSTARVEVP
jgi:sugar lactone lactonase YvrE